METTYCMTVKEMREVLANKKDDEILDFDIDIYNGQFIDEISISVYCRSLDAKDYNHIIEMSDGMVHLYK